MKLDTLCVGQIPTYLQWNSRHLLSLPVFTQEMLYCAVISIALQSFHISLNSPKFLVERKRYVDEQCAAKTAFSKPVTISYQDQCSVNWGSNWCILSQEERRGLVSAVHACSLNSTITTYYQYASVHYSDIKNHAHPTVRYSWLEPLVASQLAPAKREWNFSVTNLCIIGDQRLVSLPPHHCSPAIVTSCSRLS